VGLLDQNARVPASAEDRRILAFTTIVVVAAGLMVAALLFFATGGGKATPTSRPLYIGLEKQLRRNIVDQGPQYIANPFGGHGFWLDVEDGQIVAYSLVLPGSDDCRVKWKAQRDSYVDCEGRNVDQHDLDRYKVIETARRGSDRDVRIDLRELEPGPGSDGGG
jgi:hypothetical protein